jgi:ornithine--oxo-acid transaminase
MTASPDAAAGRCSSADIIALDAAHSARNYHPLPVVAVSAEGSWVTDCEGKRYVDFLSAYSALNFGHRHPALVAAAPDQLSRVTLTSRAMHNDRFGEFARELADLAGMDMVLPMNTGAEAVETAIKVSRKWGYDVKGVAPGRAKIVVCDNNFHGRTTTIVSFSSDPVARDGFGPFTPGFVSIPYGDIDELTAALADPDVVGFLVEPIQGEAGVVVPPEGYLREVRALCTEYDVLMIADEIQSGFGRTGYTFACDHDGVKPDMYLLGKALGGGIMPLSAVVANSDVLGVLKPGTHGSTFGGNPLACAIGLEVVRLLRTGEYQQRSRDLGEFMLEKLRSEAPDVVVEVRGRGLWAGVVMAEEAGPARGYCERILARGVIVKDTHHTTLRMAPPLVIEKSDLEWALDQVIGVLAEGPR